ncbi:hypothetical protein CEXT_414751 [Caerostris extrusa]|uniref:Uncharacterized protein n=1 Tax=Caerostris extrusa TaxID=172846 RepID=A0AAV4MC31_CAEEX|nr:hypothetical protein CEXT_414751 [Caerostris extrusa]
MSPLFYVHPASKYYGSPSKKTASYKHQSIMFFCLLAAPIQWGRTGVERLHKEKKEKEIIFRYFGHKGLQEYEMLISERGSSGFQRGPNHADANLGVKLYCGSGVALCRLNHYTTC